MKNLSHKELSVSLRNFFGLKVNHANLFLIPTTNRALYHYSRIKAKQVSKGEYLFNKVQDGEHVLIINIKNNRIEELINVGENKQRVNIRLSFSASFFHEDIILDETEYCYFCKKKYESYTDRFKCPYCGHHFCGEHRLPADHNCQGNPSAPPGGFREIYSHGHIVVKGR